METAYLIKPQLQSLLIFGRVGLSETWAFWLVATRNFPYGVFPQKQSQAVYFFVQESWQNHNQQVWSDCHGGWTIYYLCLLELYQGILVLGPFLTDLTILSLYYHDLWPIFSVWSLDSVSKKLVGHSCSISKKFFFCFVRIHQCLTMEVILSSVFGFQVDAQNNPDDPVLNAAKLTMSQTTFQKIILGGVTLLPFGMKLLENIPALFLSNFTPLLRISEEIVQTKKGSVGRSYRKVIFTI